LCIPLTLSAFTHFWNPTGFPALYFDEGIYMRRAMHVLNDQGPQEESTFYDHPYFGQLFLAGVFRIIGYPHLLITSAGGDVERMIEMLYFVPRVLMGTLAVVDTFLIYKICEYYYNRKVALISSILFAVMPSTLMLRWILLDGIELTLLLSSILFAIYTGNPK
jgi:dolichyl-phosphate-mannose--protein O-mannosyl transferase